MLGIRSLTTLGLQSTLTTELPRESRHRRPCKSCMGFVKAQHVEQAIEIPQYRSRVTNDGSCTIRLSAATPLSLQDLIFLNEDDDIRAWLLVNDGRHPFDLMVLESRPDPREDDTPKPEPANSRYRYFECNIRDHSGPAGNNMGIQEEDDDDDDDDYDQDRGGSGLWRKSSSDNLEPDDVCESDEHDKSDKSKRGGRGQ